MRPTIRAIRAAAAAARLALALAGRRSNGVIHNPVEEQVAAIWIGTSGSVDDVPVADVRRFEKEFISFLKTDHAGVLATIRETGQFSDDTVSAFKDAVAQFKRGFELGDGTLLAANIVPA